MGFIDYFASIISHWAEQELLDLGYTTKSSSLGVYTLTELTTQCSVLSHYDDGVYGQYGYNLIVPKTEPLYSFLRARPDRIYDCVFRVFRMSRQNNKEEFFKVINYKSFHAETHFLNYKQMSISSIDTLESCSLISENHERLETFLSSTDLWAKVLRLFNL
jgi:hypothetical protein